MLVNSTDALKFLESYNSRQTKIWEVLAKYHSLPDHFPDLKTSLNTDFTHLKTATSKNIQNLLNIIKQLDSYTKALGQHINILYAKLAQVEQQVQVHCLYSHTNTDEVQLEAPLYDPDIDGHINTQQENTKPNQEHSPPATPTPESQDQTVHEPDPVTTPLLDSISPTPPDNSETETIPTATTN